MKSLRERAMETSNTGLVFSIKRFAVHDGEGLRTTIFLKGCNLTCVWCHNPEGLELERKVLLSKKKCINCNHCLQIDTDAVIYEGTNGKVFQNKPDVDYQKYIAVCPAGAIAYDSKYYTVEELLDVVLRDKVFFRDGGGVTLSGGEALLQLDFVISFLKKCKTEGINTAVETALHIPTEKLKLLLPYLDTLYCDLKEMNVNKHEKFTNVNNTLIVKNIEYLLSSKYANKVVVRTPLVPNHTATKENIAGIANFISKLYPKVKYELLNYNPLGLSKYIDLGKEYPLDESVKMYNREEMQQYRNIAKANGIINVL